MVNGTVYDDDGDRSLSELLGAGPGVLERPELGNIVAPVKDREFIVRVYNNDSNTYEEVMTVLMLATSCDADEAYMEAWEIDHLGSSVVHSGSESVCEKAAQIISTIGIRVEVQKEN